ncbi:response regulator transcription factor [Stieleria varia]|nr:LuxR C-terminal-related transcriptional regulator [Stieleria varia]
MSIQSKFISVISSNDYWVAKVNQAAASLDMIVQSFPSVTAYLSSVTDQRNCVCVFLDYDANIQDWQTFEFALSQRETCVPRALVVSDNATMASAEAIKHLANLVATQSMERGEIVDLIRQAEHVKKVIEHHADVRRCHERLGSLNEREREIVDLVVDGAPNKQIATKLSLSVKTIERDRQSAYKKLDVRSTAEMTRAVILGDLHDVVFDTPQTAKQ